MLDARTELVPTVGLPCVRTRLRRRGSRLRLLLLLSVGVTVSLAIAGPAIAQAATTYGVSALVASPSVPVTPGMAQRLKLGGISEVRMPADWTSINPNCTGASNAQNWNWSVFDASVANLAQQDIKIDIVLTGRPACINNSNEPGSLDAQGNGQAGKQFPWWPNGQDAFAAFAKEVTRRYGRIGASPGYFWTQNPGIPTHPVTTWQIWNEQNFNGRFRSGNGGGASDYAAMLKKAVPSIRFLDPNAQILVGGVNTSGSSGNELYYNWIPNFYGVSGITSFFNVFAIHPYARGNPEPNNPTDASNATNFYMYNMAQIVHTYQPSVPIWVTEIGIGSGSPVPENNGPGCNGPFLCLNNDADQGLYLYNTYYSQYVYQATTKIDHMFWFTDKDCGPPGAASGGPDWTCWTGFFRDFNGQNPVTAWLYQTWFTGGTY